jgi:hypothetical protein
MKSRISILFISAFLIFTPAFSQVTIPASALVAQAPVSPTPVPPLPSPVVPSAPVPPLPVPVIPPMPVPASPTPAPDPSPLLAISGPTSFPESTLAQYTVPGATGVSWLVFPIGSGSQYQSDNGVLIFTSSGGSYQLLAATVQNSRIVFLTLAVTVTSPNQITSKQVNVERTSFNSAAPIPYSDISDEVYRLLSSSSDKLRTIANSKILSNLYSFCASKIELDGFRPDPGLKTITQATLLVKSEEQAMLGSTPLKSLKDSYPDISKLAGEKFTSYLSKYDDAFSTESRKAYVDFLRAFSNGFDRISLIQ